MITADILGERARLTPKKTALVYVPTGERLTYEQLNERAIRCARFWLETCRWRKGDRVGILAHNRVEFLDAFFAAIKSGLIVVPLNTRLAVEELECIIRDAGLRGLHFGEQFVEIVQQLKHRVAIERWVTLDAPPDSADLDYAGAIAAVSPVDWIPLPCDPEEICCLLYTSGTTGKPKGVMIPHRMVAWNGYNTAVSWQLREDDVSPVFTPLYHAGGLFAFLVPIFAIGGTIVLHSDFDPGEIWRTMEREKCTVGLAVPTMLKILMEIPEFHRVDLAHLRWLISGGAPLPGEILEAYRRRGIVLRQGYGLTEVGVNCFTMTDEESLRKAGSVGRPLLFTEARLVDLEGRDVAPGDVGELLLRGPHTSKGYWNNPGATAAALDAEGWFATGDLARQDKEGFFYIVGRKKDMYISGGENVYPAEVEHVLVRYDKIAQAAVIGVPDAMWGEVGLAVVVMKPGERASAGEIISFCRERLAKFKVPKYVEFTSELPHTPTGKIQKQELIRRYRDLPR